MIDGYDNPAVHIGGASQWVPPAERDRRDEFGDCCAGAAMYGLDRCTCWEPVYDLEQQPVPDTAPDVIPTRDKCCHDCAYRVGSPERNDEHGEDHLLNCAYDARKEFWCHQGVVKVIAFRHPDGRELPAGDGDYRPPIGPESNPVVWKADGTVGERCAGWAALSGRG